MSSPNRPQDSSSTSVPVDRWAASALPLKWQRLQNEDVVVEAAGIEPASEKARDEENYVRSRFESFGCHLRAGKSDSRLVRLGLGFTAPDRSLQPIPQNDARWPPRGLGGWSGYLEFRQRMQTACWQLLVFRSFYGSSEPGTPRHNESIPSKPLRPLLRLISVYEMRRHRLRLRLPRAP